MQVGKLIMKAAWRTCRFDSYVVSIYCNNPVLSARRTEVATAQTMVSLKIRSVKPFNPHGEPSGVGRQCDKTSPSSRG